MSDQKVKIGQLLTGAESRDAIHVAIVPVTPAPGSSPLFPGQHVGLVGRSTTVVESMPYDKCVGIIDPFLRSRVVSGDWFYLFLYPNTVTSLRHEWAHPAFLEVKIPEPEERPPSVKYLDAYSPSMERLQVIAEIVGRSADQLIQDATDYLDSGEYVTQQGGMDWQDRFPNVADEFWVLYSVVTGRKVPEDKRGANFFSCSC